MGVISCLALSSFVLSQDLSKLTVYDEQGKGCEIHAIIKDYESFVVLNGAFCVGCAEYLVNCSDSKKVFVIVEHFSPLAITSFQPIRNAQLFFVPRSELRLDEFGTIGIAQISHGAIRLIDEKKLNQLSENYRLKNKVVRKRMDSFFKVQ